MEELADQSGAQVRRGASKGKQVPESNRFERMWVRENRDIDLRGSN